MRETAARIRRRAWRTFYGARYRWWQSRHVDRLRVRRMAGLEMVVLPGVLDPTWFLSSDVLVAAIERLVRPGDRVLDLGTGTAIGALAAARAGASRVLATDADPVAVRCAEANVLLADTRARIEVRAGDLFEAVTGERFDVVAFNPPWLDRPGATGPARALRLDPALPRRFADGLQAHLAPEGQAVLVLSTHGRPEAWLEPLHAAGHHVSALLRRDRGSEVLTAWLVTPTP